MLHKNKKIIAILIQDKKKGQINLYSIVSLVTSHGKTRRVIMLGWRSQNINILQQAASTCSSVKPLPNLYSSEKKLLVVFIKSFRFIWITSGQCRNAELAHISLPALACFYQTHGSIPATSLLVNTRVILPSCKWQASSSQVLFYYFCHMDLKLFLIYARFWHTDNE